ncbi:unnamed protein product [Adineta ricciae]|uniref:G-protein coupled receptors family 1 profile domain-containing protein n=1 Tax=Adineta ricciae TaxID=249248 RepID=A0A813Q7T6_ADIRI|nr:unnamed protein product [Adineta ricciae]CAF1357914.1 unnamed protein product [Adineta ricciae]
MTLISDLSFIQNILTRYVLTVCYALGILGSILNLLVFSQKKFRKNSCSIYFIATSIFSLLAILFGMTSVIIDSYLPDNASKYSITFCKMKAYLIHVFLMLSRSSVALACVDRFALCSQNIFLRNLCQRRIALILILVICVLWIIIPIHVIIYANIQSASRCGTAGVYQIVYSIYTTIATSAPLIIMIIFSIWAIQNIHQSQIRTRPASRIRNAHPDSALRIKRRDIQLVKVLISEVVFYVLSTIWFPLTTIYLTITADISKTADRLAVEDFIRYLAVGFLIYLNSCSMFYAHILASKPFRQESQQLFLPFCQQSPHERGFRGTSIISKNRERLKYIYNH